MSEHITVSNSARIAALTLVEEAWRTSVQDHTFWNEQAKLRDYPVNFISAGQSQPLKEILSAVQSNGPSKIQSTPEVPRPRQYATTDGHIDPVKELDENLVRNDADKMLPAFYFGELGRMATDSTLYEQDKAERRPSSTNSGSSDEIILFRGRNPQNGPALKIKDLHQINEHHNVSEAQHQSSSTRHDCASTQLRSPQTLKPRGKKRQGWDQTSDEDIVADYINNMRENGELECLVSQIGYSHRDLGGADTEVDFGDSDTEVKSNRTRDFPRTASNEASQGPLVDQGSLEYSADQTAALKDEDTLVKLIAAQDLSSSSAVGTDTQASDSDCSDGRTSRRYDAMKQDEYDFMDWSFAGRRRNRRKEPPHLMSFDHCDSDLDIQLKLAWKNNRLKKAERKKQREELRALGMLRKNARSDDLRTKYPSGMTIEQVGDELRSFLQNEDQV